MRLGRRSFLKGLVAATVLSPLLAQPGPPRFLVATSMQDAVTQPAVTGAITLSEFRTAFEELRKKAIQPDADGYYYLTMQPEQWDDVKGLLEHEQAAALDRAWRMPMINRGIPIEGVHPAGASWDDRWGYASYKVVYPSAREGLHHG
jgi:hypothetical protein